MDIILLEHMDELGTVGQTVKVKPGYARNYLFPKKLACPATAKNLNFYRGLIEAKQKKQAKAKGAAELQAQKHLGPGADFCQEIERSGCPALRVGH